MSNAPKGTVNSVILRRLSLIPISSVDTIRVVSRDVKAGFIGLATSKFGLSAERIINVILFRINIYLPTGE